ncbi:epoxide hydrolase 1-like [Brachionus plicatilis]|uniref:Epoxide hydrolase n=1 Tax=Brachionus plicatilis TaxID=10195 RepID=A0A3M7QUB7_BRAPC|nr:epoxide hydrolase 1-like [Brachionus plicatilis]
MFRKVIFTSAIILAIALFWTKYEETRSISELKKIEQWAEENKIKVDKSIEVEKFKIEFDQKEWSLLKQKLSLTRYFTALEDVPSFDYGFDPDYARELVEYWQTNFDWKSQVDYLNKYPQFRIRINDTIIHYVHYITNPNAAKKVNLLLLDGWPGAFFGFFQAIEFIQKTYTDISFSIVVPSIPGFGFSNPTVKVVDPFDTALIFDALLRFLNGENSQYFIHGEDWGSLISTYLAKLYPQRVKGIHITMPPLTSFFDSKSLFYALIGQFFPNSILTEQEIQFGVKFSLSEIASLIIKKTGYFHIQATKPDSIGAGMNDSPLGLLTYILEKYSFGTFGLNKVLGTKDGGLKRFERDHLLTILTYYWMTNSITSSMRLYRNTFYTMEKGWPRSVLNMVKITQKVPVGVQVFEHEVSFVPFKVLQGKYLNLSQYILVEDGGHFANFENPEKISINFIEFVSKIF